MEEKLPIELQKARSHIKDSQQKSQERHNKKLKRKIEYKEGDKVLIHDTRLDKQWSGKLETRWKGPFTVQKKLDKGSYIINNQFGQPLKEPIHSDRLKLYQDRINWEPLIVL